MTEFPPLQRTQFVFRIFGERYSTKRWITWSSKRHTAQSLRTTSNIQYTAYNIPRTAYTIQYIVYNVRHTQCTAYSTQHATYNLQRSSDTQTAYEWYECGYYFWKTLKKCNLPSESSGNVTVRNIEYHGKANSIQHRAYVQHQIYNIQHTPHSIHHTAYSIPRTAYNIQYTVYNVRQHIQYTAYSITTCNIQHTAFEWYAYNDTHTAYEWYEFEYYFWKTLICCRFEV